jgi:hypothetical protein
VTRSALDAEVLRPSDAVPVTADDREFTACPTRIIQIYNVTVTVSLGAAARR